MSKKEFLARRSYYQQKGDFTQKEKKDFTFQEQNFIRGIQVVRDVSKNDAIKFYRKIRKRDKEQLKRVSIEIQSFYDKPHIYKEFGGTKPDTDNGVIVFPKDEKEATKKYAYVGVTKKALQKDINRFINLGGKKRNYRDSKTGEIISRRERDKRLYVLTTNH